MRSGGCFGAVSVVVLWCAASPAMAEERLFVDLRPMPTDRALEALGNQFDVEIIFDRAKLYGRSTKALKGQLSPIEAIRRALVGTGAMVSQVNDRTFVVRFAAGEPRSEATLPLTRRPSKPTAAEPSAPIESVVVVGSRAAQFSSIRRKRSAVTAIDAIVADDVGSFPDRNLNEALSRVPGAALTRNDFAEGEAITVRGNGPSATRIELDGVGVVPSGFDLAIGGVGRAADLREIPAELIKAVDIVKGNTPDLTEGGIGASILIQSRTGLDFKQPYASLRLAAERNSLSERVSPDVNFVGAHQFLEGRLGVVVNVSSVRRLNDSHVLTVGGVNDRAGYGRFADFDNSPEKTFSFNPQFLSGAQANTPLLKSPLASDPEAYFLSATPYEILAKSAAATSKADCRAAFPLLTTAELTGLEAGPSNQYRADAQAQRIREQVTCLNQWNDYTPGLIRNRRISQYEDRLSWDIRLDYRVSDRFKVYLKYQEARRHQDENTSQLSQGGLTPVQGALAGAVGTSLLTNTDLPLTAEQILSPVAGAGYTLYNEGYPTAVAVLDGAAGGAIRNQAYPVQGVALNVVPGSVVVDDTHHVVQMDLTNSTASIDHIRNAQIWNNRYLLVGGDYQGERFGLTFLVSQNAGTYSRYDKRSAIAYTYGPSRARALSNGLWVVDPQVPVDLTDAANFARVSAGDIGQPATRTIGLQYNPRLTESSEMAAKVDGRWWTGAAIPGLRSLKAGVNFRAFASDYWGTGGFTPSPGVEVPTLALRGSVRACENIATTTAANQCVYGYASGSGRNVLFGTETVTEARLREILAASLAPSSGTFFNDLSGLSGLRSWPILDLDALFSQISTDAYTMDCLKVCRGSDGRLYAQPVNRVREDVFAAYYMVDFAHDLPGGFAVDGNFGTRRVETRVKASGYARLTSIRKTAAYTPSRPNDPAGLSTLSLTVPVSLRRSYVDWLPSANLALWSPGQTMVLRASWSKTIARPPVGRLWPVGTCTVDERFEGAVDADGSPRDNVCDVFGNPDLQPYQAAKTNLGLEWYPGADTLLGVSYFTQDIRTGGPVVATVRHATPFGGTEVSDPATGLPLAGQTFTYSTYVNAPGYRQAGWEVVAKVAFPFLPGPWRHTGVDANVSTLSWSGLPPYIDPLNGQALGPPGQYRYFANLTVWYDDGRTDARISYQARDQVFQCVSACGDSGVNNYPNQNPINYTALPYNPGEPLFERAYHYVDAKVSHKLSETVSIYAEGRNLLKAAPVLIGSADHAYSEGRANYWKIAYGGRRLSVGFVYRLY